MGDLSRYWYNQKTTLTRPVKFTKIYGLPGTQHHFSVFDYNSSGTAGQSSFDVGIRIAFHVPIAAALMGDKFFQG